MGYCARVSSPQNQHATETVPRLLRYCIKHGHWSVFEMADMTLEIETSRAISAQILRHRSFSFQEFSQRYAEATRFEVALPRRQDTKNRQNSFDDLPQSDADWFARVQLETQAQALQQYEGALARGIAKECARFLLPMSVGTRLYMKGSARSWIHYLKVRCDAATQLEHRAIAEECKRLFVEQFPHTAEAVFKEE